MLLIDDLLLSPGKFVLWVLRQVHDAAEKEMENEAERITAQLGDLHRLLESGQIREEEFDARERKLLDRLEEIRDHTAASSARGRDSEAGVDG
jgi:primosomal protein N''